MSLSIILSSRSIGENPSVTGRDLDAIAQRAVEIKEELGPNARPQILAALSEISSLREFDVRSWWSDTGSVLGSADDDERKVLDRVRDLGFEMLATRVLGGKSQKIGEGGSAIVFRHGSEVAVFPKYAETEAIEGYMKHAWCAARARENGLATPLVLEISARSPYYAIMDFQPGESAKDLIASGALSSEDAYRTLGMMARRINSIPLASFGAAGPLTERGIVGAGSSWSGMLDQIIRTSEVDGQEFGDEIPLTAALDRIEAARGWKVSPVLCHMDLLPDNLLVDGERFGIIDWEKAISGTGLRHELCALLSREPWPQESEIRAFGEGYGLSETQLISALSDAKILAIPHYLSLAGNCRRHGNEHWAGRWIGKLQEILGE